MTYVPKYGAVGNTGTPRQFSSNRYDGLSFKTTPIEQLSNDGKDNILGHASGFFWIYDGKSYLITNRHVVTCKDSFTGQSIHESKVYFPERVRYFAINWININGQDFLIRKPVQIDLYDQHDQAVWLQHPDYATLKVDVVAIPIGPEQYTSSNEKSIYVNRYGYESLFHMVGSDVFITGYPFRSYEGAMIPIWKRGTLAHEPSFLIDDKPIFLIDAITMGGMSGSPVYRRVYGPACKSDMGVKLDAVCTTEFVGVYSGRMASRELQYAGLGIGWYGSLIDEVISRGTTILRHEV